MTPHRRYTAIQRVWADSFAEPVGVPAGSVEAMATVDESEAMID
jgi:hypothetical protein